MSSARDEGSATPLAGTVSVVIGGSGGIGQAVALRLAQAGSQVVVTARQTVRLAETIGLAEGLGLAIRGASVDILDLASIRTLADEVVRDLGVPTILVNSAGVMVPKPAFDLAAEEWDLILNTQLRGPFLACQVFGRHMADQGYGKIVNLSSTWAVTVADGRSAYCAAKAGLGHLTTALACEWARFGVRVNAVAPAATMTPAAAARFAAEPGREALVTSRIPLGRLTTAEDVASAVRFLAEPSSDFITGETIFVDGGWRAAR